MALLLIIASFRVYPRIGILAKELGDSATTFSLVVTIGVLIQGANAARSERQSDRIDWWSVQSLSPPLAFESPTLFNKDLSPLQFLLSFIINMSSLATDSNIGTVKGMYESFAEGDIEAVAATWAADIEFNDPEGFIGGGTFHGSDEIIENAFGVMATVWEEVSVPGTVR